MSSPSFGTQVGQLARRSTLKTFREPMVVLTTLVFPLFFLAVTVGGLAAAPKISGFPTDSYLTFALSQTFVQAGMNAVITAGGGLAEDIQTGFLSRLSLTPLKRLALIAGHLAGTLLLGLVGGVLYIAVGLAFGADLEAGPAGGVVIVLISMLLALAFGSIGVFAALRTGSGGAVQAVFPLLFVLLFLSSLTLPRNLIEADWFRTIADYNPMSYFIEAPRSLLIAGWDWQALALGCGMAAIVALVFVAGAVVSVKSRMLRT